MNTPQIDDLDALFLALGAGDPLPVADAILRENARTNPALRRLLAMPDDAPVAAAFTLAWEELHAGMSDKRMLLLKWYAAAEAATELPKRREALLDVVTRLLDLPLLPPTEAGCGLAFVAIRTALEIGGTRALRGPATAFLRRHCDLWTGPDAPPLQAPMLQAAIQTADLSALRRLLDRLPDADLPPDLQRAVDWSIGTIIEFAGIDPWLAALIDHLFRRDPRHPANAQRKAQLGLHQGQPFAALASLFHDIRLDPADPSLKPALQFSLWHAQTWGLQAEIELMNERMLALAPPPDRPETPAPPRPTISLLAPLSGLDLPALTERAAALAVVDLTYPSPFTPTAIRTEFDRLALAVSTAQMPANWGIQSLLQAAQRLIQVDLAEVAWITHFVDAPHANGLPHYGSIDLVRIPEIHAGLMTIVAALCQRGLDWMLSGKRSAGNGPLARLGQLHTRACLQNDATDQADAFLDRIAEAEILKDAIAIERDNCRLQRGDMAALQANVPPSRQGSTAYPFQTRGAWTQSEALTWTPLAKDAPISGAFEIVWPDGTLQSYSHTAPAGQIALARVPGLRLVSEDILIGPKGHALRPDTYHTSAEFPWPSFYLQASAKRALRLRPTASRACETPVLVLEAFEALRWRNFYHWMIPILSRIAFALEKGLLTDRQLVVPEGLSPWMTETLTLLGLTPDRLLVVPVGHEVHFSDAVLMSSIEHISRTAIHALRESLFQPPPSAARPPRALFLSRGGQRLRKMHNEAEIEDMARSMGFEVVAPQDFSIPDQVSLFRQARAIAAVEGAALTNTMFCPPDTRILAFCCINDMMPVFNDISLVQGHHHRKLAGHGQPDATTTNRFQPPFVVDLDLARQSLAWALEGMS